MAMPGSAVADIHEQRRVGVADHRLNQQHENYPAEVARQQQRAGGGARSGPARRAPPTTQAATGRQASRTNPSTARATPNTAGACATASSAKNTAEVHGRRQQHVTAPAPGRLQAGEHGRA